MEAAGKDYKKTLEVEKKKIRDLETKIVLKDSEVFSIISLRRVIVVNLIVGYYKLFNTFQNKNLREQIVVIEKTHMDKKPQVSSSSSP